MAEQSPKTRTIERWTLFVAIVACIGTWVAIPGFRAGIRAQLAQYRGELLAPTEPLAISAPTTISAPPSPQATPKPTPIPSQSFVFCDDAVLYGKRTDVSVKDKDVYYASIMGTPLYCRGIVFGALSSLRVDESQTAIVSGQKPLIIDMNLLVTVAGWVVSCTFPGGGPPLGDKLKYGDKVTFTAVITSPTSPLLTPECSALRRDY